MTRPQHFIAPLLCVAVTLLLAAVPAHGQACVSGSNRSLVFDGLDDWARIPDAAALDGYGEFTITFWCRTSSNDNQGLVSKYRHASPSDADDAYSIRVYPPGVIRVQLASGSTASGPVDGGVLVADGQWHHVAITRNGDQVTLYVDGAVDTSFTFGGPLNGTDTPLALGALLDASDAPLRFLAGDMDDLCLWSVHRDAAQIQQAMTYGVSGSEPGLVACWRMDASAGQTVADATANGLDGTLGADNAVAADDPSRTSSFPAPIVYCGLGAGQANSPEATLLINGAGVAPAAGPFVAGVPAGSPLVLEWQGTAGAPFMLAAGAYNGGFMVPGIGSVDIGTPPTFADLLVLIDGFSLPGAFLFQLNPNGSFTLALTAPNTPPGTLGYIQSVIAVPTSPATPVRSTAAFRIDIL